MFPVALPSTMSHESTDNIISHSTPRFYNPRTIQPQIKFSNFPTNIKKEDRRGPQKTRPLSITTSHGIAQLHACRNNQLARKEMSNLKPKLPRRMTDQQTKNYSIPRLLRRLYMTEQPAGSPVGYSWSTTVVGYVAGG